MAIKMVHKAWCPCTNDYKKEFILDSAEDAANLPESCPGSTAIVAGKDGAIYMVNASGSWEEL